MSLTTKGQADPKQQQAVGQQFGAPQQQQAAHPVINRLLSMAGKATLGGFVLIGGLTIADAILPDSLHPSMLLGRFPGRVETAEILAKQDAAVEYARRQAAATANAQADAQIEAHLSQTQQQARLDSLSMQQGAANLADAACLGSGIVAAIFGHDADHLAEGMKAGCGMGDQLRGSINRSLAGAAQTGSGVVARGVARPDAQPVITQPTVASPVPQQPVRTAPSRYYPQGQLIAPGHQ